MSEITLIDIGANTGAAPVTLRFGTQGYVTGKTRKNLILQSEAPATWATFTESGSTVLVSTVVDPILGNVTRVTKTAGVAGARVGLAQAVNGGINGTTFTGSIWVKRNDNGSAGSGIYMDIAKNSGTLHTAAASLNSLAPGQWTRISGSITSPVPLQGNGAVYLALFNGDIGASVDIWHPQFELGLAPTAYIPTTTAQVTVNPGLTTNLAKYSEQFDNSSGWSASNITFTPNATVAPNGQTTAELFTATATSTLLLTQNIVAASTVYTYSIFVKQGTRPVVRVLLRNSTTATNFDGCIFDFSTPGLSGGVGWDVYAVGNGWYRLSYTRSTGITIGDILVMYAGSTGDVVTAGHSWYMWGAQLEEGATLNEYVGPTLATPVTGGTGNAYYENRVSQPGNIQRSIFDRGTTFGASQVSYGEVLLVNNDGGLDYLLPYGFAGFPITITRGTMLPNQAEPVWSTVLVGTMDSVDFTWNEVSIKVRDRQQEMALPIQASRYGGTNALPNGLDGVATDIKGNGRPILYGKAYNFTPPQVNTTRLIYELSDGLIQSVDAVYDRGAAMTAGAAYASQVDMETTAPAAGQYRSWLNAAGSYIRLGSAPAGTITVDATQGAATSNRTAAQLLKQAMLKGAVSNGDISATDVTALDTLVAYETGYWVASNGSETVANVLDAIANSVGAWWGVDRLGKFRMGRILSPNSANSIGTLTTTDIISIDRTRSGDQGGGVPAWQVKLNYAKMFVVQNDLAAAVSAVVKSDRAEEWRTVISNDSAVKTQWPKAVEIEFNTFLISASDAAAEATRRLNLYKVRRDTLTVKVKLTDNFAAIIDLGATVMVQVPRFGMSSGKAYLVTGIRTDLRNNTFDLTLWG